MHIGVLNETRNDATTAIAMAIQRRDEFVERLGRGSVGALELLRVVRKAGLPLDVIDQPATLALIAASGMSLPAAIWLP